MEEQLARGPIDLPFLMLVTILTVVGAIMVFSASYPTAINEGKDPANYFFKQAGYGAGGLVAMYVISKSTSASAGCRWACWRPPMSC